jgi:hypothetical protein
MQHLRAVRASEHVENALREYFGTSCAQQRFSAPIRSHMKIGAVSRAIFKPLICLV